MTVNGIASGNPVYQTSALSKKPIASADSSAHTEVRDKIEISAESMERFQESTAVQEDDHSAVLDKLKEQFPNMSFSVGSGLVGKNAANSGENADRWAFTVSAGFLEKAANDPAYAGKLKDIQQATAFAESFSKALGMKTTYCENYIDDEGNLHHAAVLVRKDEMNEELRAQAQENAEKLLEAVREKNAQAADRLASLMSEAQEKGVLILDEEDMKLFGEAAKALEESQAGEAEEETGDDTIESEKVSGCVAINAQKLARMLAAAKTRGQIQAIMAKIQADLKECETGKSQGLDVDEASVSAAESLLTQAKSQMASAEDREPTPQEEMAQAMASLM